MTRSLVNGYLFGGLSFPIRSELPELEESATAPYPEPDPSTDLLGAAKLHKVVEHCSRDAGLDPIAQQNIRRRFAAQSCLDAQRVRRPRCHNIVEIGPED